MNALNIPIVIGFGYKARRGKDTAVQVICRAFPYLASPYAFADVLREEIRVMQLDQYMQDGMPMGEWSPSKGMKYLCEWAGVHYVPGAEKQRALLQWWGTEFRRNQDPDYWVKALHKRIARERPTFALISDMRFLNEFNFCHYRIRMDRLGFEIDDGQHHISETGLDTLPEDAWDKIIVASSPAEVAAKAVDAFRALATRLGYRL